MANSWGESGTTWGQGDWGQQNITTVALTGLSITTAFNSDETIGSADRGWGADTWNNGEWGELNDDTAILTGLSFSADVGVLDAAAEQGWGRDSWGLEPWGESNSPTIALDGLSFSANLGTLSYAQSIEGWGRDEWGTGNWGQNTTTVAIDGFSMSMELGPNGWGIHSFGDSQWGGEFTFNPESIIVPTGQTLAADLGTPTISRLDMIFTIAAAPTVGVGIGTLSINNGADHSQGLPSLATGVALGTPVVTPNTIAALTGQTIALPTPADITPASVELIDLTGVTFAASVGLIVVDSMSVGLTGVTFSADEGSISPTNMTVGLTGQTITASLNTIGFGTIGYEDVDITGNTSYTDVNHAA